ncbi:MAG TPA: hypothetical protein VM889_02835 [Candidatus Thermoplasmatota archaeon]|nr:hypothetical protein [Candidatus Thermoplasmatota archaeon]
MSAPPSRLAIVGVSLLVLTGFLAVASGILFIVRDEPFTGPGGEADDLGVTAAEVEAFSPHVAEALRTLHKELGYVSLGWGVFVAGLAIAWHATRANAVRLALWAGAVPTLLLTVARNASTGREILHVGTLAALAAFALFAIGMALTYVAPSPSATPPRAPA